MRGHQHGGAGVDAGEQLHDVDRGPRVEVAGRLIGEQHLRPVHQGAGDRDALLLTAGQLVRHPLLLAVEPDEGESLGNRLLDEAARRTGHLQRERHVLVHRLRREEPEVLEHRADVTPEVRHLPVGKGTQIAPEHGDAARCGHVLAQDQPQTGGLAGTRGADEEDELPALHFEVDTGQRGLRRPAVVFRDVLEPNHGATSLSAASRHAASDTPRGGRCHPETSARCRPDRRRPPLLYMEWRYTRFRAPRTSRGTL